MGYTIKEQYKYHCKQSKVGAVNSNGEKLTSFSRGVHFGKAKQIASNAKLYNLSKKKTNFSQRKYSKEEFNSLFDNPREIKFR